MVFSPFLTLVLAFSAAALVGLVRAAYLRDRPAPNGHSGDGGLPTRGRGPRRAHRREGRKRAA